MAKLEQIKRGLGKELLMKTGDFSPSLAELYDEEEFVLTFSDLPFVGFFYDEPVLGIPELWIRYLHNSLETDPLLRASLYSEAFSSWPEISRIKVWFNDSESPEHPSEVPLLIYVEKPPGGPYEGQLDLRPTDSHTAPFVQELLGRAFLNGYRCQAQTVEMDKLRQFIAEEFPSFNSLDFPDSIVVFNQDRPIGHATWRRQQRDPISGNSYSDLIDIYILEDFSNLGLSRALSEFVASEVPHSLRGDVVLDSNSGFVLDSLSRTGWKRIAKLSLVTSDQ